MKRTPWLLLPPAALVALWVGVFLDRESATDCPLAPPEVPLPTAWTEPGVSRGPDTGVTEPPERARIPATKEMAPTQVRPVRSLEVKGTVTDPSGARVPGARVELYLGVRGYPLIPLGSANAPNGVFASRVELPEDSRTNRASLTDLYASASAPGHRRARLVSRDLLTATEPITFELVLSRGSAVRGRVLDAAGSPVADALVIATTDRTGEEEATGTWVDGTYEIGIPESGLHELWALHQGVGQSPTLRFELDASRNCTVADLRLRSGASLRGTTRYPDGSIAARVRLLALPERDLDLDLSEARRLATGGLFSAGPWNLARGSTVSDERGRFQFQGLQEGRYFVLIDDPGCGKRGARALHPTGETQIEVTVDCYRVRVRAIDSLDRPLPGTHFGYSIGIENESMASSGRIPWPEGTAYLSGYRLLRPGSTASATVWVPSWPKVEVEREIVEGIFETRLEVQLAPPAELATLKLELVASDGAPLETCQVKLFEQNGVRELHGFTCRGGPVPPLRLAPGHYQLVISPREQAMHYHQGVEELELEGGETHELRVELVATGSLLVRVHRPAGRDRLQLKALRLLELPGPGASSRVETTSAISNKLSWHLINHCRDHSGEADPYTLPSFDLLDAGRHRLELEFHDCLPVERHVEIVGGRTEELEIWLEGL